jgi:alkanesulfonate monooxygenase SsuD/methylene tetrahydromethanopterin reductase-like flavin-dependent oxidoreductase (luciferase family)
MKFGIVLPITIGKSWKQKITKIVEKVEEYNYDSILVWDHYMLPERYGTNMNRTIDAWTLLSFISGITKKVKIGTCVTPIPFRPPSILAKMVASVDHISDGRVVLGVGAGWHKPEFDGYSQWDEEKKRVDKTEEGLKIMKKLWSEDTVNFKGKFYNVEGAILDPKPIQKPYPQMWFGSKGMRMINLMLKYGSAWIPVGISSEQYSELAKYIKSKNSSITLCFYDHMDVGEKVVHDHIDEYKKAGCEYFLSLVKYEEGDPEKRLKQFSKITASYI